MVKSSDIMYLLVHPTELRSIIQWKVWHNPVHERNTEKEEATLTRCFFFLDMTSRSFSAVIKELHPELLVPVCIFYLILRGLDTIEDDVSIPLETKDPMLRNFQDYLEIDGWTFNGNRPEEKDRQLLVEFDCVITEFKKLKPVYREILKDITKKMGDGMADYCANAEHNENGVANIKDYDLYCHYVAGLVGDGLTRLFVESDLANPQLLKRPQLANSMGLFLQKTNIIRDVREDFDDKRRFWPKEIWSRHVDNFEDLFKPENLEIALNCSSDMVLNALEHVDDCLFYLAGLREQSVFNFCAIPQSMAIATLTLCFRNPDLFKKSIKITKGTACQLMVDSTQNLRIVCNVFLQYAREIHKRNTPKDPNFLKISIACGKIEKFVESIYPTQTAEAAILAQKGQLTEDAEKRRKDEAEARSDTMFMLFAVFGVLLFVSGLMIFSAWLAGARFDVAWHQLRQGHLRPPNPGEDTAELIRKFDHGEL